MRLLEGWYLGQEGGNAVADVAVRRREPGRQAAGDHRRATSASCRCSTTTSPPPAAATCSTSTEPLFPFGYGLSYTTFEIGAPRLSAATIGTTGSVRVSVDVTNTGERPATKSCSCMCATRSPR